MSNTVVRVPLNPVCPGVPSRSSAAHPPRAPARPLVHRCTHLHLLRVHLEEFPPFSPHSPVYLSMLPAMALSGTSLPSDHPPSLTTFSHPLPSPVWILLALLPGVSVTSHPCPLAVCSQHQSQVTQQSLAFTARNIPAAEAKDFRGLPGCSGPA